MKKLTILRIILVSVYLSCPNLIQAQNTASPDNISGIGAPSPDQRRPNILPLPIQNTIQKQNTSESKYAEYQSYCRQNDFDETQANSKEQRLQQIETLKSQIKAESADPALISDLVKNYLEDFDFKNADSTYLKYKDSLSEEEEIILSSEIDIKKNKLTYAANKLEQFSNENPKLIQPLVQLAHVKQKMGLLSEAIEIFLDLQKMDKKSDHSLKLCEIYTLDSYHKDAEKFCQKAIKNYPDNPLPSTYLGISYREREQFKEAKKHFENSIQIRPTEFALTCLGELYFLMKDKQKMIEYLNLATEQNKSSYRAQIGLALVQFQEKQYDIALKHFVASCKAGNNDTLEMRKAHRVLEGQGSSLAAKYHDEIQKCKAKYLF